MSRRNAVVGAAGRAWSDHVRPLSVSYHGRHGAERPDRPGHLAPNPILFNQTPESLRRIGRAAAVPMPTGPKPDGGRLISVEKHKGDSLITSVEVRVTPEFRALPNCRLGIALEDAPVFAEDNVGD